MSHNWGEKFTRKAYDTHILVKCSYTLREQKFFGLKVEECGCGGIDRFVIDVGGLHSEGF